MQIIKESNNGKEKQTTGNINYMDYGARMYDDFTGRWFVIDPLAEKYYFSSVYAYCVNNPINAIDIEGKAIVFINGMDWKSIKSVKELPKYWGGFDNLVKHRFGDDRVLYRDGSMGGLDGMVSEPLVHAFNSLPSFGKNISINNRMASGYEQGVIDAPIIISQLKRKDGQIIENLRIITHSMGAGYAKGYIRAILDYAKKNLEICQGLQITEYDFAPFQPTKQSAIKGVPTYQFSHSKDWLAGDAKMDGAIYMDTSSDTNQSHSITDFWQQVQNLPEGNYKVVNGSIIPQ